MYLRVALVRYSMPFRVASQLIYHLGLFQPLDIGINRVYKHSIRIAANAYFTELIGEQIRAGIKPEMVKLPTKVGPLRDATVGWIQKAFDMLKGRPEIRQRAWSKCEVGPWNLSWDSITSKDALTAFLREEKDVRSKVLGPGRVQAPERRKRKKKQVEKKAQKQGITASRGRKPLAKDTTSQLETIEDAEFEEPFDNDIQDDITTPLQVIETAVSLPLIPPPDTESQNLLSSKSTTRVVNKVNALRQARAAQFEQELAELPKGYHYTLRNRGEVGISYNEDSEASSSEDTEMEDEEFEAISNSDLEAEQSDIDGQLQYDEAALCQQLGGLGVDKTALSLRVFLHKAGRTGGGCGTLVSDKLEPLKRGIVKWYTWRKIRR